MMATKAFSLAEQVRGEVGAASLAAMDSAAAPAKRDIATITDEIRVLKARGGEVLLEIGKRLCEAKAQMDHGAWLKWLAEEADFSERKAQELMQIAREFPNPRALADLGKTKVLKLLLLPEGTRGEFLDAHDVSNMSTRELDEAIRRQKELEQERDEAQNHIKMLNEQVRTLEDHNTDLETRALDYSNQNDDLRERVKALESAPKEFYRDDAAIEKAAEAAREETRREMQREIDEARDLAAEALARAGRAETSNGAASDKAICDFIIDEIEHSANRLYGHLLKAVNADPGQAEYIRTRFRELSQKFGTYAGDVLE